ncbi:MAG: hypothetical protein AUJ92_18160 [Armatimonadetes bacterium CG2_30_59_28]|nr:DUF362 domain-containing protein [Armatimonadota bacterium]OIO90696.1 MAG: hypothetical protein AUJ92_18160 [Armatimonadetes bacterium CG2_30_59_28]PIU63958.1 MAG: hypothetical protein COS85_14320 [Armatimonadetes bacterium CG07_land_8_20_14_0_80_59_28]PIX38861.1 MAG: hypothetical protein COZ56_19345 [Armatimonadetes bacterium CG_4_8_14_3_um_filter_58_9]PIY45513.1 MAG: hypothetical protein COZ05_06620 [Armatimonadetes bacterium CG_4_10_14_3_um_filter_59_10]PJB72889.1 MAG: hypothetical prote
MSHGEHEWTQMVTGRETCAGQRNVVISPSGFISRPASPASIHTAFTPHGPSVTDHLSSLSRRRFLQQTAAAGGALLLGASRRGESAVETRQIGRVARFFDPRFGGDDFDLARARKALDTCMSSLFKVGNPAEAWSALFSPSDVVAIKVNCLGGPNLSTRPGLVQAVIDCLVAVNVKPGNIIVFDRKSRELAGTGYTVSQAAGSPIVAGTDELGDYETNLTRQGTIASRLSKVVSSICTAIINVPILKDHKIVGVSAALKNYFGVIDNPNKYHDSAGDPHVPHCFTIPSILGKDRLTVCDALTASFHGGPGYDPKGVWRPSCILVATDPVALDYVAWYMVEHQRQQQGLKSLAQENRKPEYIFTSAKMGLGIKYPTETKVIDLRA